MRPFVHWGLAWTAFFAVMSVLQVVTQLILGNLGTNWQSVPGAIQSAFFLAVFAPIAGFAMSGIGAFFDWLGWGVEPQTAQIKNPILRLTLLPIALWVAVLVYWYWRYR